MGAPVVNIGTVKELLAHNGSQLPVAAIVGTGLLSKIRSAWRAFREFADFFSLENNRINFNSEHARHIAAGTGIWALFGDNKTVRFVSRAALVAARIIEVAERLTLFSAVYQNWKKVVIDGDYQSGCANIDTTGSALEKVLSPVDAHRVKSSIYSTTERVKKVAFSSLLLVKETFFLAMTIMDLFDACSLSRDTGDQATIRVVASMARIYKTQESLSKFFVQKETMIGGVIDTLGFPIKGADVAGTLRGMAQASDKIVDAGKQVAEAVVDAPNDIVDGAKIVANAVTNAWKRVFG